MHIDWTISVGNILTTIAFVGSAAVAWGRLEAVLARLIARVDNHDTMLLTQDRRISDNEARTFELASRPKP